jgi:hypothetical protein
LQSGGEVDIANRIFNLNFYLNCGRTHDGPVSGILPEGQLHDEVGIAASQELLVELLAGAEVEAVVPLPGAAYGIVLLGATVVLALVQFQTEVDDFSLLVLGI